MRGGEERRGGGGEGERRREGREGEKERRREGEKERNVMSLTSRPGPDKESSQNFCATNGCNNIWPLQMAVLCSGQNRIDCTLRQP